MGHNMPFRLLLIASLLIIFSGILHYMQIKYFSFGVEFIGGIPEIGFGVVILIGAIRLRQYRSNDMLWVGIVIAFSIAGFCGSYLGMVGMILGVIGATLVLQQRLRR